MKYISALLGILFSNLVLAESTFVRINKDSPYQMVVNFQICLVEPINKSPHSADCYPKIRNFTLKKDQHFKDIRLDNSALFVRIISAYTFDDNQLPKGHSEFGPEDCKGFNTQWVVLENKADKEQIVCLPG